MTRKRLLADSGLDGFISDFGLTFGQTATLFGTSVRTLRRWRRERQLPQLATYMMEAIRAGSPPIDHSMRRFRAPTACLIYAWRERLFGQDHKNHRTTLQKEYARELDRVAAQRAREHASQVKKNRRLGAVKAAETRRQKQLAVFDAERAKLLRFAEIYAVNPGLEARARDMLLEAGMTRAAADRWIVDAKAARVVRRQQLLEIKHERYLARRRQRSAEKRLPVSARHVRRGRSVSYEANA